MIVSFRNSLNKIGGIKPKPAVISFPRSFHSTPKSLRTTIEAMNSPEVEKWYRSSQGTFHNKDWTEECQGVTNDGQYWYISSNNKNKQGIHKFTPNMNFVGFYPVGKFGSGHIGDIDYHKGIIYAAMEHPAKILMVDGEFKHASDVLLRGKAMGSTSPQGNSLPWCAVNPWNGYLYSSRFEHVTEVYAYDPQENFLHKNTLKLSKSIHKVQGGCFSNNGHLLLTSEESHNIQCFSVLNGTYLGAAPIRVDRPLKNEVEGITIWKNITFNGIPSQVHVILLDNEIASGDDVYFKHFTVPAPENL